MDLLSFTRRGITRLAAVSLLTLGAAAPAWAVLTITPITWNIVGLDSNTPLTGPYQFPVGARVCAVGSASTGAITASMAFVAGGSGDSACAGSTPCVTLRTGSLSSYQLTTGNLAAGSCADAYFEVEVKREVAAYTTARRYTITAVDTVPANAVTTPQPRELYVERLISQNRNSVQDVSYSAALALSDPFPTPQASLTSVAAGGTFGLAVGGIYDIRLDASTATQGYEQLETFANFSNAVFRVLRVHSTYSANTSPFYPIPPPDTVTDLLYANACNWQLSPVLPNYLSCQGVGKTGGTISATYRIQVLTVPGGTNSVLNTLIYDYSGSSFHYNADNGEGGRTITIIDPLDSTISKAFVPATINPGGVSKLTFTITNPNFGAVTGYGFTDVLPAGLLVAPTPNVAFSGCSVNPTITATAGSNTITASGGAAAANSTCSISVDVTGATVGTYLNGTAPNALVELLVNGSGTGSFATATLTIGSARPPVPSGNCTAPVTIMSNNFTGVTLPNINAAPPTGTMVRHASAPGSMLGFTAKALNVPNPSVAGVQSINTSVTGSTSGVNSWQGTGFNETNVTSPASSFEITVDSSAFRHILVTTQMRAEGGWASNPQRIAVSTSVDGGSFGAITGSPFAFNKNQWVTSGSNFLAPTSGLTTVFRLIPSGTSQAGGPGFAEPFLIDDIVVTGCPYLPPPTITKAFAPATIGLNATSTLTLTIVNPNASALTGVAVSDPMPAGVSINAAPAPSTTCGGTLSAPAGANQTIALTGGGIAASSSCTITVSVTGTTAGLKTNVTNAVSSIESGTNTSATGTASANLRVIAPPTIAKNFVISPIPAGTNSTLRFTVTNPNAVYTMSSVGFTDTFPLAPGAMVVATPAGASNGCGGTWTTTAGAGSVTLSGVSLAPGASCSVAVAVTAPVAGTYNNVSGAVSHVINAATLSGNTASASLVANTPVARIGLQKRVSISNTGPWGEFVAVAPSTPIFYQFTVENTGDVVLNRPASGFWITDSLIPGGPFCAGPASLSVANSANENHIFECVVATTASASVGTFQNTGTATGTPPAGADVTATNTASYTTELPNLLVDKERIVPAGAPGTVDTSVAVNVTYRISVENQNLANVNDTLAPIIVEDTLRSGITYLSFTSPDPFWSCSLVETVPLHKVSCTYSGQLLVNTTTTVDLNVLVAAGTPNLNNTAVALNGGDPECDETTETPDTECKGPWFEATLPVTLSDVAVQVEAGQLVVEFGTAAEAGTLGFRVLANRAGQRTPQPVNDGLVMASGAGFEPRRYEARAPYAGQTEVFIEEVATDGQTKVYGPYAVGSQTGERELYVATDWAAIAAEQSTFREAQAAAVVSRGSATSNEAELRISSTGLVRIGHQELLASGIDWTGVNSRNIRLSRGSSAVPMRYEGPAVFGPDSAVYFLGESVSDSQYTRTAAYRLSVSEVGGSSMRAIYSGIGRNVATTTVGDVVIHAPNRGYDLTSSHSDPWYAQRLVRANVPVAGANETFVVPDRASNSQNERIEVDIWGGLNWPASPDHSVRLLLNGSEIARKRFDGLTAETVVADLPQGVLVSGNNTLRMELIGDTGVTVDVVFLESIRVYYTRELKVIGNRLAFVAPELGPQVRPERVDTIHADDFSTEGVAACRSSNARCASYQVGGLTRADVNVFRADRAGNVEQLTGSRVTAVTGGFELAFSTLQADGDRYWIEPAGGSVAAVVSPKAPVTNPLVGGNAEYLIISHPSFISGLAPLVAARLAEGMTVRVIDVENIYDYYNRGTVDPSAIGAAIADAYGRLGTRYVLLVGGDTYDYFNYQGANSQSFIPSFYRATGPVVRFAPVDSLFADVDSDGLSDIAVGRFPIRTMTELNATIAKTLAYSSSAHSRKLLTIADRTGLDGVGYDDQLTALNGLFGPGTLLTTLAMDNYPAGSMGLQMVRSALVSAVNSGQSLVTFFGHSGPSTWSAESLVTASLVHNGLFNNASAPTVVWVLGCYGSYYVSPTYNTVAQALMVQANGGGAAAVIGTSSLTNVNSDLAWMNALRPQLGNMRIGDAVRQGQRSLVEAGPQYYDVSFGGMLLGDPALRLRD